jgi:hypothetical protein
LILILWPLVACGADRSQINGRANVGDAGHSDWPPLIPSPGGAERLADSATLAAFIKAASEITCLVLNHSDESGFESSPEFWTSAKAIIERRGLDLPTYTALQERLSSVGHGPTQASIYEGATALCEGQLSPSGLPRRSLGRVPGSAPLGERARAYVEASVLIGCAAVSAPLSDELNRESLLESQGFDERRYIEEGWRLRGQNGVFEEISMRLGQCGEEP